MWIKAQYQCRAVVIDGTTGQTTSVHETSEAGTLDAFVTEEGSARHAAWRLWRDLIDYHQVLYIQVSRVDWRDIKQRWQSAPLAYRFQGADLRADSPAGSRYA